MYSGGWYIKDILYGYRLWSVEENLKYFLSRRSSREYNSVQDKKNKIK